jgi:hypothetical protein
MTERVSLMSIPSDQRSKAHRLGLGACCAGATALLIGRKRLMFRYVPQLPFLLDELASSGCRNHRSRIFP